MKFFLFLHKSEVWIVNDPQIVPKPRELLLQSTNIELIREKSIYYASSNTSVIVDKVKQKRTRRHTPEGLLRIAEAKMGDKNPNANGLSDDHKTRISRTMRGTRNGENNPMYNRRHRADTIRKIAFKATLRRRLWCVEPSGKTHLIDVRTFSLPAGWQWGRFYDVYKTDL